ncbi:MAG: cache domain-containing protein [Burkholderiales bacterium]|nr:cache domain-containing protein [Burkholderiales bacterium]
MRPRLRLVVLALIPLLLALATMATVLWWKAGNLAEEQARVLEEKLLLARRTELAHYVELALDSIGHLYDAGRDDDAAQLEARSILSGMSFGEDGYFFVYDFEGRNLVHPRMPQIVGENKWELTDANGVRVIQELVARAREGGGYQRYLWDKPSTKHVTPKLGYAVQLERWGWMIGTGIYLDDVESALQSLRDEIAANIASTMRILAAVAVLSVGAVSAGGLLLNLRDRRIADGQLRVLAQRIVFSQEAERARVSRELHDGLSQLLVSLKYRFELVEHRLVTPGAEPVRSMARELHGLSEAIAEVRRISHALRPSALDDLGLATALEQSAKEFSSRTGISVNVRVEGALPWNSRGSRSDESDPRAVTLFRIAQEALANVERHSQARHVEIQLACNPRTASLSIVDDGIGFEIARIEREGIEGIGLRNIRERIEHAGGEFFLSSGPGRTELRATVPAT